MQRRRQHRVAQDAGQGAGTPRWSGTTNCRDALRMNGQVRPYRMTRPLPRNDTFRTLSGLDQYAIACRGCGAVGPDNDLIVDHAHLGTDSASEQHRAGKFTLLVVDPRQSPHDVVLRGFTSRTTAISLRRACCVGVRRLRARRVIIVGRAAAVETWSVGRARWARRARQARDYAAQRWGTAVRLGRVGLGVVGDAVVLRR